MTLRSSERRIFIELNICPRRGKRFNTRVDSNDFLARDHWELHPHARATRFDLSSVFGLEPMMGIEPMTSGWKPDTLPLRQRSLVAGVGFEPTISGL